MGMGTDIRIAITATKKDIPNADTGITDTTGAMLTTDMVDASINAGLAAIATRVINANQSAITIARI
jgi:hypothetical protein